MVLSVEVKKEKEDLIKSRKEIKNKIKQTQKRYKDTVNDLRGRNQIINERLKSLKKKRTKK